MYSTTTEKSVSRTYAIENVLSVFLLKFIHMFRELSADNHVSQCDADERTERTYVSSSLQQHFDIIIKFAQFL